MCQLHSPAVGDGMLQGGRGDLNISSFQAFIVQGGRHTLTMIAFINLCKVWQRLSIELHTCH